MAIYIFEGEVDFRPEVQQRFEEIEREVSMKKGGDEVVFDLAKATHVDSMGIGQLMKINANLLKKKRQPITLQNVPAVILKTLSLCGLQNIFRIVTTPETTGEAEEEPQT